VQSRRDLLQYTCNNRDSRTQSTPRSVVQDI
jgi:hypothetical protein